MLSVHLTVILYILYLNIVTIMGSDELGDSQTEMKFIPKIFPRNDEDPTANVDDEEKLSSAKSKRRNTPPRDSAITGHKLKVKS